MFKRRLIEDHVIAIFTFEKESHIAYWYNTVEDLKNKKLECRVISESKAQELILINNPIIAKNSNDLVSPVWCADRDKIIQLKLDNAI